MNNEMQKKNRKSIKNDFQSKMYAILIAALLCICVLFFIIIDGETQTNEETQEIESVKILENCDYKIYVTIDDGETRHTGTATIIASDETTLIIQMNGCTFVAPISKVSYK